LKLEMTSQYSGSPTNNTTRNTEMLTPLVTRRQPIRLRLRITFSQPSSHFRPAQQRSTATHARRSCLEHAVPHGLGSSF
jgi:hypothetical protein